jgi:ribosome biogenesis protein MAK21
MYFNLLYKAMKYDTDANRVNVFAKRLMCTVIHSNAAPIAGSLFLLNEISKTHDGLKMCMEGVPEEADSMLMLDDTKREPRAALVFSKGDGVEEQKDDGSQKRLRHPPSWELALVSHHFHPSVAKFANTTGSIEYVGDPLKDFGLAPFLDKFAYRNPKSRDKVAGHYKRGESIAERRSGTDGYIQARLELPMNDPSFLEREDVNEQDEFFQKFFVERARRDEIKGIARSANKVDDMDEEEREVAEEEAFDTAETSEGLDTGKSVSRESDSAADVCIEVHLSSRRFFLAIF